MTELVQSVLILLGFLQVKHMFADYFLQTPKMLEGRGSYLHSGRAQHALVHAVGTIICLGFLGSPLWLIAAIALTEWIVHFHIDWAKASYSANKGHGPQDAGFWRAAGFDQLLHQLTYLAIVWAWVVLAVH